MAETRENQLEQLLETLLEGDPGRSAEALESLRNGMAVDDVSRAMVEKAVNTAALLLAMGQSEQACVILEALLQVGGEDASLLNNLAFAHLVGGRVGRAVELWERAASAAPQCATIAGNLARAKSRMQRT